MSRLLRRSEFLRESENPADDLTSAQKATVEQYGTKILKSYRSFVDVKELEQVLRKIMEDPDAEEWKEKLKRVKDEYKKKVLKRYEKEERFTSDQRVQSKAISGAWSEINKKLKEVIKASEK